MSTQNENGESRSTLATGSALLRLQWKKQLRKLIADKNGGDMLDFDEYLEALAVSYYDEPLADGLPPSSPEDTVWEEWLAAS